MYQEGMQKTKVETDKDINNSLEKPNQIKIWAWQCCPFKLKQVYLTVLSSLSYIIWQWKVESNREGQEKRLTRNDKS